MHVYRVMAFLGMDCKARLIITVAIHRSSAEHNIHELTCAASIVDNCLTT